MPLRSGFDTTFVVLVVAGVVGDGALCARAEDPKAAAVHWAFRKPERAELPAVRDGAWVQNPIDRFILARLERDGIAPSPEAERTVLVRRLSFDLRGLPPSPAEVRAFVEDREASAYERLVNRWLLSEHCAERQARQWLDVARYADSNGYTRDFPREIWKYRDWCIEAFRRDLPFDQFVIEQFAGDLLPDATLDQIVATGFHRNTQINEEGGTDPEQFRIDAVADRLDTTGVALLGLTVGCARCHDHKFDPISQREYYRLFAFLDDCDEPLVDVPAAGGAGRAELAKRDEIRARVAALEKELRESKRDLVLAKQLAWEATITPEQRARYPGDVQAAIDAKPTQRTDAEQELARRAYEATAAARRDFAELAEIAALRASEPRIARTMVLRERAEPRETFVHVRGNFLDRGERVVAGVPAVLHPLESTAARPTRLDLARWIASPENPLTPRVMMNRLWMQIFGTGLVETENDFGTQGTPPSHPELLDWLATEFVAQGFSLRAMHRLLVSSATYRQSSERRSELERIDPLNRLLARQSRLRLDAEIIRDAALAASGLLVRTVGGPSVFPPQPDGVFDFTQDRKDWRAESGPDRYRRGMYTHLWRSSPYPALAVLDFPSANVTCTRRVRTNTPLQALILANDPTFVECAQALARRALAFDASDDRARVSGVFELCVARPPRAAELERLAAFVDEQRRGWRDDPRSASDLAGARAGESPDRVLELATWTCVARVLLNTDEFITRD